MILGGEGRAGTGADARNERRAIWIHRTRPRLWRLQAEHVSRLGAELARSPSPLESSLEAAIAYRTQAGHHASEHSSSAVKNEFKGEHLCPAAGRSSGSWPGYVIDHVDPLECGGADASWNMQWQTAPDDKAKDQTERNCDPRSLFPRLSSQRLRRI